MVLVDPNIIRQIMPLSGARADVFADPIAETLIEFQITTPQRIAAFLAQIAHESGQLLYTEEIASGSAYEGRIDLGNTEPGDGIKFKGRGLPQITGRANYKLCGAALGYDLLAVPSLLSNPVPASRSAGWFWRMHDFNKYADKDQFGSLTHAWNGGYNGLDERIGFWLKARQVLGL